MRITNRMMTDNAIQSMAENLEKMNKLQDKLSSMKQFQTASEDPVRSSASLSLRSNLRTLESYMTTADSTINWMTASDSSFQQLEDLATRANTLVLRGLNDSLSGSERASTLGAEMQTLLTEAVDVANTNVNGQYIFSGYLVNTKAFTLTPGVAINDTNGNPYTPQTVAYTGDTGNMQRNLGPDQSVTLNVRGDQAISGFLQNLKLASDALMSNNIHDSTDPAADNSLTLQTALSGLQSSLSVLDQYRTSNGARMRQVESASNFLETVNSETKSLLSKKEDTNMAEGIALLTNQKTTYEAVLQVSQRAISALSLFDYLQ
ncbi:MAG: hypothetical protein NT121_03865 [Chloroflexi bacterium]|nr:hypothetical protein [Chloroflexota bacterium]